MKKISKLCILSILISVIGFYSNQIIVHAEDNIYDDDFILDDTYTTSLIYTPNNTAVTAWHYIDDYTTYEKERLQYCYERDYNVVGISLPTSKYNCHSYAFYSQDTENNDCWISDPTPYISDKSYIEISEPISGDIIAYFDDMDTTTSSDDDWIHSGIISEVLTGTSNNVCGNSNLVNIISKWGQYGLFSHRGDECIYTTTYGGAADYVKYYRRHYHNYSMTYYTSRTHIMTCECGNKQGFEEYHAISQSDANDGNRTAVCLGCNALLNLNIDYAIVFSTKNEITENGSYMVDGIIVIVPADLEAYLNGTLMFNYNDGEVE